MWFNQVVIRDNNSGNFIGVNMTEEIIEHFQQYHQDPDCDSMEQFSSSMFGKENMITLLTISFVTTPSYCNNQYFDK